MGSSVSKQQWIHELHTGLKQGKNTLWQRKLLPKVMINNHEYAMDLNLTFWAHGMEIKYMFTVARIQDWKRYLQLGTMNVAQGGGFAPLFV